MYHHHLLQEASWARQVLHDLGCGMLNLSICLLAGMCVRERVGPPLLAS